MAATMRYARKNEVYASDIEGILDGYDAENTKIVWLSMSREQQRYGNKSRWAIMSKFDDEDDWEEAGQLFICTKCERIYPVMAGNVYDEMEYCEECGVEVVCD